MPLQNLLLFSWLDTGQLSVSNPSPSPWHPGSLVSCFCPDLQNDSVNPTLALAKCSSANPELPSALFIGCSSDLPTYVENIELSNGATLVSSARYRLKEIAIDQIPIVPYRRVSRPRARSANDIQALETQNDLKSDQIRTPDTHSDSVVDGMSSATELCLKDQVASGVDRVVVEKMRMRPLSDHYEECQSMLDANTGIGIANNNHSEFDASVIDQSTVDEANAKSSSLQITLSRLPSLTTSVHSSSEDSTQSSSLWRTPPKPLFKSLLRVSLSSF